MQKFLIPHNDINGGKAVIRGQDAKHIAKVLRMRVRDKLLFTDGNGKDYTSIIIGIYPGEINLLIKTDSDSRFESPARITVFQGMLKDNKMDTLIRHLTELGIHAFTPLLCERTVPKPNKKRMDARLIRWKKISAEALKQCNRSILPEINRPVAFSDMFVTGSTFDLKIAFWENAGIPLSELNQKSADIKNIAILIGPEGGFSKTEAELAETQGFHLYSLGPRILRAETASMTACSLIQHYYGDI